MTESYLRRIEDVDPRVNSYITVTSDGAREEARRADAEIGRGSYRGTLHGIPIALKDLIDTAGVRTTAASRRFRDRAAETDAEVVGRLRSAGAVILGKLMLYEFALGPPRQGDAFPPARNPWNLDHVPGGSSSGSGSAVAARLCAAALGTDAGGSVRRPAAESGVVGVKPSQGLVSQQGLITHTWSLDQIGPLARSVEDAAAVLDVIAGPPAGSEQGPCRQSLNSGVAGLRALVPSAFIRSVATLQPEVLDAFSAAVAVYRSLGAEVVEVDLPPSAEHAAAMLSTIVYSEVAAYHEREIRVGVPGYGLGLRERLLNGAFYSGSDYVQAQRARSRLAREFEALLRENDVMLTPTMPTTAPTLAAESTIDGTLGHVPFTRLFNLSGGPSVSVPCGHDLAGLPIGLMVSGRRFNEATILRAAHGYERAATGVRRPYPDL